MNYLKITSLFALIISLLSACSSPQQFLKTPTNAVFNETLKDEKDKTHLIGLSNRAGLQSEDFQEWFNKNYDSYEPKKEVLEKCKNTKDVEVLAFMGTWCGDSRREIPRFYKVMDEIGFKEKNLKLVNVYRDLERYKQSPTGEEKGLNIHRVPTFVFYKEGKEIGRIVESPVTTLEIDVAQILNGIPSQPNYKVVTRLEKLFTTDKMDYVQEKMTPFGKFAARNTTSSSELNTYGYILLSQKRIDEAIATFTINTLAYPQEANTFDSLAEAYMEAGKNDLAIENYEKALSLEPESESAQEGLKKLMK